jgi:hypothetical protein
VSERKKIWALHRDDERSQRVHAFWYRFESHPGVIHFTFDRIEDVPKVCECGNEFFIVPESAPETSR